jgi:hypothetical protein
VSNLALVASKAAAGARQVYRTSVASGTITPPSVPDSYLRWLRADTNKRIVLAELGVFSSGFPAVRYVSNGSFVSTPTDSPANTAYVELVNNIPQFSSRMEEQFSGQSLPAWGDLEIKNSTGDLDSWLDDAWDGRSIDLYLGDPAWPKSDFRKIMSGTIADIYAKDQRTLAIKIRDKQWKLNVPVQKNLIGGTTANKDQPIPICYGLNFNVEPVLIDASTNAYQVHDGAINAINAVYDNGVSVAFTATLSAGTFVLTSAPVGRITADVQGSKPGGSYLTRCADIMQNLITTRSLLTTSDMDLASFSAFNTLCPQPLGLYVRERDNMIPVLDSLIRSVGGFYTFSRDGLMQLGRLDAPSGTPVIDLIADDVAQGALRISRRQIPITTVRLGYRRNWTLQPDGLAGSVSQSRRADLAAEYLISKADDTTVQAAHPLALSPDVEGTLLTLKANADTEAARRLALYGTTRTVYTYDGFASPFRVNLGEVVRLTHPRYGFSAGALAVVVGIVEQPTKNRVSLDLWK